jgi:hypothetical protein
MQFTSVQRAFRVAIFAMLIAIYCPTILQAQSDGIVTHQVHRNVETWRINEPNVKKNILSFPQTSSEWAMRFGFQAAVACKPAAREKPGNDM